MRRRLTNRQGNVELTLLVVVLGLLLVVMVTLFRATSPGSPKNIVIARGASLVQVANLLHQEGIIESPLVFKWLTRFTGGNTRVRAGEFRFQTGMSMYRVLSTLYYSEPVELSITVPEGWTVKLIARRLANLGLADEIKFVSLAMNKHSAEKYNLSTPTLEGFLYPETYYFSRIDGEDRILDRMVRSLLEKYEKYYRKKAEAQGLSLEKLVTLASIVEKETGVSSERPLIASVFHNRLRKRMRLQSDPTTIYGIRKFNGNLTKADLERYSPYNTYVIHGLPRGPIASPGEGSLSAVLSPANTDYLYFVSNNDGTHLFSKSYEEHSRHVNSSQKTPGMRRKTRK